MESIQFTEANKIETRSAIISARSDGIVCLHIKDYVEVDVEDIKDFYKAFRKLKGKKNFLMLVQAGESSTLTKEAREYAGNYKKKKRIIAKAVIVNNLAQRLIVNFYIKFHKPKHPLKLFTDMGSALEWLKAFDN